MFVETCIEVGLVDLMPFRDDVNPLLISEGYTALRNSANHDVQLVFNKMDWGSGKLLRAMVLYTYMQDYITGAVHQPMITVSGRSSLFRKRRLKMSLFLQLKDRRI